MKKILIVDDSEIILDIMSIPLRKNGYHVDITENGYTAMEKILLVQYDLVITDINMPGMDGYELIKNIRNNQDYIKTPIILISTENELSDIEKGIKLGATLYIVKPVKTEVLLQNIEMLIEN